jgi:hypothetical protein
MDSSYSVAYIVITNGRDIHADMALVSMLSMRISNPNRPIIVVCDHSSAQAIRATKHRMLEACDELIEVETPDREPVFRNRWIKTQLCRFVSGNFLYIDSDTLVRGLLDDIPNLVREFGAVANHNGKSFPEQIWHEERACVEEMGWSSGFDTYYNGGVWFVRRSKVTDEFFESWHRLWFEGFKTKGRTRDQPSLNIALRKSGIDASVLPETYNAQVQYCWKAATNGQIWHFFSSMELSDTCFFDLLSSCGKVSLGCLRRRIRRAIRMHEPWRNQDLIARWIDSHLSKRPEVLPDVAAKLWLLRRRIDAVRYVLGAVRAKILGRGVA